MSKYMLNDQLIIDNINPFVELDFSLPGTWSGTPEMRPSAQEVAPAPPALAEDPVFKKSIICDFGITAGDRTIDLCAGNGEYSLSRPYEPQRIIQPDSMFIGKEFYGPRGDTEIVIHLMFALVALYIIFVMTRR